MEKRTNSLGGPFLWNSRQLRHKQVFSHIGEGDWESLSCLGARTALDKALTLASDLSGDVHCHRDWLGSTFAGIRRTFAWRILSCALLGPLWGRGSSHFRLVGVTLHLPRRGSCHFAATLPLLKFSYKNTHGGEWPKWSPWWTCWPHTSLSSPIILRALPCKYSISWVSAVEPSLLQSWLQLWNRDPSGVLEEISEFQNGGNGPQSVWDASAFSFEG